MGGKTAVVTGAGSGIGRAITLALAADDCRVVAADIDLEAARVTALENPKRIAAIEVDVADQSSVAALKVAAIDQFGVTSILVNAAGWDRTAPFLDATADFTKKVVAINYLGPVNMCSAFLPDIVASGGGGRIVNVASDAGRVGSSGEAVYAGAKGGVIALSKSLAREVARHEITVNCVCPGPTDTPMFHAQPERLKTALLRAIPFRRLGSPEEVAAAVLFFTSSAASFITGQVLSVSGGLTMAG